MSDPALQPDTSGVDAFTQWYKTHGASLTAAQQAKYQPYMDQIKGLAGWDASTGSWDNSKWPTYNPVQWGNASDASSPAGQYAGQQAGLDALMAKISAGPQASDYQNANDLTAQSYGYSPASYSAIQQGLPERMNASNVMNTAASVATGLQSSPFGQQQQQARDIAARQAQEAVGKQLEAIFGERGGLAGFQAAYDMTSQLQNTMVQQQAQDSLAMLDRSIAAVNAENQYYQDLVNQGAIQAQDFVRFRWDNLQTGYQDYMAAMDQTLQQWTTQEQVSEQQYNQQVKVIQDQLNAVTGALAQEMGIDEFTQKNAAAWYAFWSQVSIDFQESGNAKPGATTTKPTTTQGSPGPNPSAPSKPSTPSAPSRPGGTGSTFAPPTSTGKPSAGNSSGGGASYGY